MRILQIAPLWETVPPPAYGGTEAVVYLLCNELVRQGHDVTLCASGDSRTSAELKSFFPRSLRTADEIADKHAYSRQHAILSMREARSYDIIHNHAGEEVMALHQFAWEIPMLTTMHCLITKDNKFVWDRYHGHYNTISWAQRRAMPNTGGSFACVVHNAVDVPSFPFQRDKDDYLLFLSRLSPEKGPHIAVEVARRAGRPLIMAGKVDAADAVFFRDIVAPLIDGHQVRFLGEADAQMKRALYRNAAALLMPITWDEPFGLVLAEALACGTPVITFDRGAAPEIVSHGQTGFVVDNVDQMTGAVRLLPDIDPGACRDHVARHFDGPVMAANYLRLYESVLKPTAHPAPIANRAQSADSRASARQA